MRLRDHLVGMIDPLCGIQQAVELPQEDQRQQNKEEDRQGNRSRKRTPEQCGLIQAWRRDHELMLLIQFAQAKRHRDKGDWSISSLITRFAQQSRFTRSVGSKIEAISMPRTLQAGSNSTHGNPRSQGAIGNVGADRALRVALGCRNLRYARERSFSRLPASTITNALTSRPIGSPSPPVVGSVAGLAGAADAAVMLICFITILPPTTTGASGPGNS